VSSAGDDPGDIDLVIGDGLAVVTIDHAGARNSLTITMVDRFHEVLDELESRHDIGAGVVRGSGEHFCSGLDRGVFDLQQADPAGSDAYRRAKRVYSTFQRLGSLPVPTFAAVRGAVVGAGLNLAMAVDLRVVADDARLIAGFPNLGLHPGGGFFALATRLLGREAAVALGVVGEEMSGRRAADLGFAWSSVTADQVEKECFRLAGRCVADLDLSRATIASFRKVAGPPGISWDAAVDLEHAPQMWTFRRLAERSSP
jgi:enoyl-CoA hydratase